MNYIKNKLRIEIILLLVLITSVIYILYITFAHAESNVMKVYFIDVGQGDAIFIEAPNQTQMLIDAGRGAGIINSLESIMPFGDRHIDIVLTTHPDADHIGGLDDVLQYYAVDVFIESGANSNSQIYKDLETLISEKNILSKNGRAGERIILDIEKGVYFDILYPDTDLLPKDTNDASIIGKLTYGETSVLLTGDASIKKESYLINKNSDILDTDILKLGHHGSRTSTSSEFLRVTSPDIAIISAGLNNQYGHPHKEVLDKLNSLKIPYLGTYNDGTILCESDAMEVVCK